MKKNNVYLIIIIILVAIILFGLGIFVGNNLSLKNNSQNDEHKDNNIQNNTTDKEVTLDINSDTVKYLFKLSGGEIHSTTDGFGLYTNSNILVKDIGKKNQEDLLYLLVTDEYITTQDVNNAQNNGTNKITLSGNKVKEAWTKLFGSNVSFGLANYDGNNGAIYGSDGTLTLNVPGGRFEGPKTVLSTVKRATKNSEEIVLYEAVKFIDFDTNNYYTDLNKTNITTENADTSVNYKKVFKKDSNGNFYLYSVEKI